MAPRSYQLKKRAEAVEATRHRIIEAVVQLHAEKGVVATTYDDIAKKADVALATVYRHYPTLDQLVPACGGRIREITVPPGPEIFDGKETASERIRIYVREFFDFWTRMSRWVEKARCDAATVPALARGLQEQEQYRRGMATLALGDLAVREEAVRVTLALTDFYVWKALSNQALEEEAALIVTKTLLNHLNIKD